MERPYANGEHKNIEQLFVGTEVEDSKFKGERTLFVPMLVKQQGSELKNLISKAKENSCTHVYLGANKLDKFYDWGVILEIIKTPLNVTLDVNARNHFILGSVPWSLLDPKRFNLMISLEVPAVQPNMVSVKLDDVGFGATNPGVWVAPVEALTFTAWDKYIKDELI